jgi:hypothetical protein
MDGHDSTKYSKNTYHCGLELDAQEPPLGRVGHLSEDLVLQVRVPRVADHRNPLLDPAHCRLQLDHLVPAVVKALLQRCADHLPRLCDQGKRIAG